MSEIGGKVMHPSFNLNFIPCGMAMFSHDD